MSNMTQEQADALSLQAAYNDDRQFSTLAHYHAALENPLYERSEAYRELVDNRLKHSKHLYENSAHKVNAGEKNTCVRINMDTEEVTAAHPGDPGWSKPDDIRSEEDEVKVEKTRGGGMIVTVRAE